MGRELEKLLKIPINNFNNILTVLQLTDFDPLLELFDFDGRKAMAVFIANDALETQTNLPTEEQVMLFAEKSTVFFIYLSHTL